MMLVLCFYRYRTGEDTVMIDSACTGSLLEDFSKVMKEKLREWDLRQAECEARMKSSPGQTVFLGRRLLDPATRPVGARLTKYLPQSLTAIYVDKKTWLS